MSRFKAYPVHGGTLVALVAGLVASASAQMVRVNNVEASIPSFGLILATSPLVSGAREPTGNIYVSGTVTFRQNGPWALQVKLSTPFVDMAGNKVKATNEVRALLANSTYTTLGTSTWVTVATGPGTASTVKPVKYFIVWGKSSAKNPSLAVSIPVMYQVVPL